MKIFNIGFNLLSQTPDAPANQMMNEIFSFVPLVIIVLGLSFLSVWLFCRGGFTALKKSPVRRNTMPGYVAIGAIMLWLSLSIMVASIVASFSKHIEVWKSELIMYSMIITLEIGLIVFFLWIAKNHFVRGLKGFGLNHKTISRDIPGAGVNLIAVYPLVIIGLYILMEIGKLINGADWQLEAHPSLQTMSGDGPAILKYITIIFAVTLAPIFEEIMFRGILQSAISTSTNNKWLGIIATSFVFTLQHPGWHCLAIFALSVGFGYAYERSGSLYRSIFMHMMFNASSVIGTLLISG